MPNCVNSIATLKKTITSTVNVNGVVTSTGTVKNRIASSISITQVVQEVINTTAALKNKITSQVNAKLALNNIPCPLILCIDGGNASTLSYPPVNGLIMGGGA